MNKQTPSRSDGALMKLASWLWGVFRGWQLSAQIVTVFLAVCLVASVSTRPNNADVDLKSVTAAGEPGDDEDIAESLPRAETTAPTTLPTTTTLAPSTTTTAAPLPSTTTTVAPPRTTIPPSPTSMALPPPEQLGSASSNCHPSYDPCLPIVSDVDCAGGSGNGPVYTGRVNVIGPDEYDLDRDGDGVGCENG